MANLHYLARGLQLNPTTISRLLRQLDSTMIDDKLSPERFSPREVIAHLADFQTVIRFMMETAVKTPGATVPRWHEDQEAISKNYAAWDLDESISKFEAERRETMEFLYQISEEDLKKTVDYESIRVFSVIDLAILELGHDCYHIEQLTEYLVQK